MKVLRGYKDLGGVLKAPVVAIGIFDGMHIGHRRVMSRVLRHAPGEGDKVIMTFDPHPQIFLGKKIREMRIMSLEHRLLILRKMGFDAVVVINFNGNVAAMTPEGFVKDVLFEMGARKVYVGENFYFGRNKSGSADKLSDIGAKYGIDIRAVRSVRKRGRTVSSTWLRKLITSGKIEEAEKLLRRPVSVFGTVVKGDRRGAELGFPTANIDPHHEVIPPPGVYAVKVDMDGKIFDGVLNIGFKPTFFGSKLKRRQEPHIEVHVMGFQGDLYGKDIEIFFIKNIRKEKRFRNADLLVAQINKDLAKARELLASERIVRKIRRHSVSGAEL